MLSEQVQRSVWKKIGLGALKEVSQTADGYEKMAYLLLFFSRLFGSVRRLHHNLKADELELVDTNNPTA